MAPAIRVCEAWYGLNGAAGIPYRRLNGEVIMTRMASYTLESEEEKMETPGRVYFFRGCAYSCQVPHIVFCAIKQPRGRGRFLKMFGSGRFFADHEKKTKTGGEMYAEVFFMSRIVNYGGGRKKLGIHWLLYTLL